MSFPRTAKQKMIFGILMAMVMVYGMEVYNAALKTHRLLREDFLIPIVEFIILVSIVMVLQGFIGSPIAKRVTLWLVDPENYNPTKAILVMSTATVLVVCPLMSVVATFMFKWNDGPFWPTLGWTIVLNFPVALLWQLAVAGPSVRLIYRRVVAPLT